MNAIAHLVTQTLRPPMRMPAPKHTYVGQANLELAIQAVDLRERGMSNAEIAKALGRAKSTISSVICQYKKLESQWPEPHNQS